MDFLKSQILIGLPRSLKRIRQLRNEDTPDFNGRSVYNIPKACSVVKVIGVDMKQIKKRHSFRKDRKEMKSPSQIEADLDSSSLV